jgi:hypothetical protein
MSATVLLVLLLAALLQPELANDVGLKPWSPAMIAWQRQSTEPDPLVRVVDLRFQKKQHIIDELVAGRLTLFEAAALFNHLNHEHPVSLAAPWFPGDSEEERVCRQVIHGVRARLLSSSPENAHEWVAALEEDLRQHKECHRKVILPNISWSNDRTLVKQ